MVFIRPYLQKIHIISFADLYAKIEGKPESSVFNTFFFLYNKVIKELLRLKDGFDSKECILW